MYSNFKCSPFPSVIMNFSKMTNTTLHAQYPTLRPRRYDTNAIII
jgi:hypothetical protein